VDTHIGRDLWTEKRLEAATDSRFIGKRETAPEDDTDDAGGDFSQNWVNAAIKYAKNVQDRSPTKPTTVTRTVTAKKQEMQHECECAVEGGDPEPETAVAASGLNDATAMRSELGVLLEEALEKGEIDEHEFHKIFAGTVTCWDDLPDAIKTFKCSNTKFKLSESNYTAEYSKLMQNIQVAQEEARKQSLPKLRSHGCVAQRECVSRRLLFIITDSICRLSGVDHCSHSGGSGTVSTFINILGFESCKIALQHRGTTSS
jgi:hypothetical protein